MVENSMNVALVDSLGGPVRNLAADYGELALDSLFDNEIVEAVPIISTLRHVVGGVMGLRERHTARKLLALIYGVGSCTDDDRRRWRERLDGAKGRSDVAERVVAIVDALASAYKAELIGRALRRYLDFEIDQDTFLRTVEMVHASLTEDLRYFMDEWQDGDESPACHRLTATGLMQSNQAVALLESSAPPSPTTEATALRPPGE